MSIAVLTVYTSSLSLVRDPPNFRTDVRHRDKVDMRKDFFSFLDSRVVNYVHVRFPMLLPVTKALSDDGTELQLTHSQWRSISKIQGAWIETRSSRSRRGIRQGEWLLVMGRRLWWKANLVRGIRKYGYGCTKATWIEILATEITRTMSQPTFLHWPRSGAYTPTIPAFKPPLLWNLQ